MGLFHRVEGSGFPVVSLHGFAADHRLMAGCLEPVFSKRTKGRSWKRIYPDLPGMGSSPAVIPATSDAIAAAVLETLDELIPGEPFLFVGESYGGYLARSLLRLRPERVAGLFLLCPVVRPLKPDRDLPPRTVIVRDEALSSGLDRREAGDFADGPIQTEAVWRRFQTDLLPAFRAADKAFLRNLRPAGYTLAEDPDRPGFTFEKPSLILLGRQDTMVGYRDQWRILEAYPRASFAVLDRAGHNLQFEQLDLFEALVNEWLDRVEESLTSSSPRP